MAAGRATDRAPSMGEIFSRRRIGDFRGDASGRRRDVRRRDRPADVFPLLFLTLGPFKLIAPFAKATRGMAPADKVKTALLAAVFALAILAIAGGLGEGILAKYGIPLPFLTLAGGLILFLSALMAVLQQSADAPPPATTAAEGVSVVRLAMTPLAFPGIVTPYGIAAFVVFLALAPDAESQLRIDGMVAGILALDVAVMLLLRWLMPVFAILLPIVGPVLGVVQVALGLEIMKVRCSHWRRIELRRHS